MKYEAANDFVPDLSPVLYRHSLEFAFSRSLPSPMEAIAIGWLGDHVETQGSVPAETLAAIRWAHANRSVDQGLLGFHICNICGQYDDRGEFLIQVRGKNYLMPKMILHYIEAHSYCPPAEYIADVDFWWKEQGQPQQPHSGDG